MPFSEDNTLRVQAEDILLNSEELIRLILDSASEAICGCDSEGICLFSNPSAARILGYDHPAELLGKNMHALEHHTRKDGTPYPIEECPIYIGFQKNENVHRDDEVYWRKDGTSFPVEFWSHIVIREGKTLGAVIPLSILRSGNRRKRRFVKVKSRAAACFRLTMPSSRI